MEHSGRDAGGAGRGAGLGACDGSLTPPPLAPLVGIAAGWGGALRACVDSGADRFTVFRTFLDELSTPTASLAVIEDVPWADAATLDLLRHVGRRIAGTRSMLIATYRDDESGSEHRSARCSATWRPRRV